MVAYMIIFSAITSLELFIQVGREGGREGGRDDEYDLKCTTFYVLTLFNLFFSPSLPPSFLRNAPSLCTRRRAGSTAPAPTSSPRYEPSPSPFLPPSLFPYTLFLFLPPSLPPCSFFQIFCEILPTRLVLTHVVTPSLSLPPSLPSSFLDQIFCEILPTRLVPTLFYAVITAYMAGLRTDFYHLSMYWLTLTGMF